MSAPETAPKPRPLTDADAMLLAAYIQAEAMWCWAETAAVVAEEQSHTAFYPASETLDRLRTELVRRGIL